ncbi:MAG: nicotinamide-nucleotide amidohydrolase family protein [Oscillospiraceae bacterium]|nr:nicotinamide-nucleotide amidohydrolase family protein [Oscillospiraceae bacterium]
MDSVIRAAEALLSLLQQEKLTLAVAEGSSGGALSQALTALPGASAVFQAGIVGYSDSAKQQHIGVPAKVFRRYGAVSEEAAAAMAHLVRGRCKTSLGLSVTGIEGPSGGSDGKPVGTVYIAVSDGKRIAVQKLNFTSDSSNCRLAIREQSVLAALSLCQGIAEKNPEALALCQPVRRYRRCLGGNFLVSLLRYFLPWPGDRFSDVFFKLLLIAAIAAGVWAASQMTETTITDYHSAQVLEQAVAARETEPTPETESNLPEGYLSQFAALYELNEDIAGWITIPDTNVNLPVMQCADNSYYLSHDINKGHDINGLPFMDFRNKLEPGVFSTNTLVYGHNMTSGMIFRDLVYYRDPEYYKAHPIVTFDTVYDEGQWVIFSCFEANTEASIGEVFQYFNFVNSKDPDRIQWYINEVTSRSYFTVDIDVSIDDQFLTLQTCANDRYETKVCVVARRLRDGESASDFDFDSAVENTSRVKPIRY